MRHQMDAVIGSVRRLATELRPRVLDDVDFREAVIWHTEDFFKRSDIRVSLDLQDAELVKDDALATALFRIVQEALTNVVRHANATEVNVSLRRVNRSLILAITDNGQGFSPGQIDRGVGLVSMRERCAGIGAQFAVLSEPMGGTRVEVTVPLTDTIEVPTGVKQ
jgi:signal transduction histidine kinase